MISSLLPGASRMVSLRQETSTKLIPQVVSARYQGDSGLRIELLSGGVASDDPRLRITRSSDSTSPGLVRGTILVRVQNLMEEMEVPIVAHCSDQH
ncbi:MAG: hypothetical protein ACQESR_26925 [Planctomycetota bacterium]